MILIIPSSSPKEATLPLYGQANQGPEAVNQSESQDGGFQKAAGGFSAQTPGSPAVPTLGGPGSLTNRYPGFPGSPALATVPMP